MINQIPTQEGCCLAFTVGFPLLGRRHRKHVYRCFTLATQILQDIQSPLSRLRAQLHLEVRKQKSFVIALYLHVNQALGAKCACDGK